MDRRVGHYYRFGTYRLDATDRVLYKNADLLAIPPKVFDVLLLLVTNHGRVLSKDEILKQLWPDTFVEDGIVTQYISLLRKALGDDGKWVQNLPRRGYRFTAPVDEPADAHVDEHVDGLGAELVEHHAGPAPISAVDRWPAKRLAGAAVCLIVIAAGVAWRNSATPAAIRSIAVLPFVNLNGEPALDYISEGLSDELTGTLARVEGLRVASRKSALQFRGRNQDLRQIRQRLNVAAVLGGSVRIRENRVQVDADFVDARNGNKLWSETYKGGVDDLLDIQQRIATATAKRLALEIHIPDKAVANVRREVFLPYLQGRYFLAKGRPETFRKAVEEFEEAISKEPRYARAYSGLADAHYRWALWENSPPGEAFADARQAAARALALDATIAEAHASLANIEFQYDWDYVAAEREFRRSIALDPYRADTWHWFSHLLTATGRFKETLDASKRAIELDPFDLPSQNHLGWCYYFAGDYDRAIQQHRKVLELDPIHGQTRLLLGRALAQKRLFDDAVGELRKNLELSPDSPERLAALAAAYAASGAKQNSRQILDKLLAFAEHRYVSAYSLATVYAAMGDRKQALAYLDKASVERSSRLVEVKYEPIFEALRDEPAFRALLHRMGL